jgi:hypothetical protein
MYHGRIFQQTINIFTGINCCHHLNDVFFFRIKNTSYRGFSRKAKRSQPDRSFNFTSRYTDDILLLNNSKHGEFVDRVYLIEFELKYTTEDTAMIVISKEERNFMTKETI